jgi:hypothetical protein
LTGSATLLRLQLDTFLIIFPVGGSLETVPEIHAVDGVAKDVFVKEHQMWTVI